MIWFGLVLVWFYDISTIVCYLMPNPVFTYILNIYDLVWLAFMPYQHCVLFNAKSCLYIYSKYIPFGLVGFMTYQPLYVINAKFCFYIYINYMIWFVWFDNYGISIIVCYLMPNPVFTYVLNIYALYTHFVDTHSCYKDFYFLFNLCLVISHLVTFVKLQHWLFCLRVYQTL